MSEAVLLHNVEEFKQVFGERRLWPRPIGSRVVRRGLCSWEVQLTEPGGIWVPMGRRFTRRGALSLMASFV